MELRVLKYLLIVAREENITRAAELLHISQPTLSRQLMQLEEELGVKLFQRGKHNVYLTSEGALFRRRAQEIVELSERAKDEMNQRDDVLTGSIAIGSGEFRSVDELCELIASFSEMHPQVTFELHSAFTVEIKTMLEQGLLDMGLLMEPVEIAKYDFVRMRTKETWGILVRDTNRLAALESVAPADLEGARLIGPKNALIQGELANWFGDVVQRVDSFASYNLLYNAAVLARRKDCAVVCLDLGAAYEGLRFVPFASPLALGSVLAWKEPQSYSKATAAFIRHVKECKKKIPDDTI